MEPNLRLPTIDQLIEGAYREAATSGCSTLLLSSEDFSLLSIDEWQQFLTRLSLASKQGPLTQTTVVYSARPASEWTKSAYSTLLRFGLAHNYETAKKPIQDHFSNSLQTLRKLSEVSPMSLTLKSVDFAKARYLELWLNACLPQVASEIPLPSHEHRNKRLDRRQERSLLAANKRNPVPFRLETPFHWPEFHNFETISAQRAVVRDVTSRG